MRGKAVSDRTVRVRHRRRQETSAQPGARDRSRVVTAGSDGGSRTSLGRTHAEVCRLVAASKHPTVAVDEDNRIVSWNRAATALLGFSKSGVVGKAFQEVIAARDAFGNLYCSDNPALHEMAKRGEPIRAFTLEVTDVDEVPVQTVVSVDALPGGNPSRYHLLLRLRPERRKGLAGQIVAALLRASPLEEPERTDRSHTDKKNLPLDLTVRQREVLRLLARGQGAQGIAETLSISVNTARNHIRNIETRLGVHNQAEAVAVALRHRLI
jgi:DNA-binding CsgD family transcriptional regulator/PAS domain-containing protein